jgi:uncharacterized membrane protein YgcG
MKNLRLLSVLLFGLLFIVGCESKGCQRKREVGRVYTSAKTGHLYVRAHEKKDNDFIFFVSDDGSNWSPASSIPDDLFSTRRVVPELRGVPSGKVEEEELAEEEVIDENTTEAEADAVDSDTGADADGGSGDSGGDGGGDGGGGDGGGSD